MNKRTYTVLNTIYDALFELLSKQSFEKITVMSICDEADVNKMTFYKYHQDKYDALAKAFENKFYNEFNKEFGKTELFFKNEEMTLEEKTLKIITFMINWCIKYEKQIRNLMSNTNQLAFDCASHAMYKIYYNFIKTRMSEFVAPIILEHTSRIIYGGFVAGINVLLDDLNKRRNREETIKIANQMSELIALELIHMNSTFLNSKD